MQQYLAIVMPTKKCEGNLIFSELVNHKKNVRKLRFSCFKKPGILIKNKFKNLKIHSNRKSSNRFLVNATYNLVQNFR